MFALHYLFNNYACLLFYKVNNFVCRTWLTHGRSDHWFLWNIILSLRVLDGTGHTISRSVAQDFNRSVLTMGNGVVPTPCTSILCVY